jgi:hypothetical protein
MVGQLARLFHFGSSTTGAAAVAVHEAPPAVDRSPVEQEEPFECAAFSITARRYERGGRDLGWFVDVQGIDWDTLFSLPRRKGDHYEESAFRQVAALSGWRLTNVVPAGANQRRLYYERI